MNATAANPWPLVTIVTPSLNQGRFLRSTLESVAGQDYPHIEHLVLDAGSTDESHDVLRAFAAAHPAMRFRIAADRGQSDAINQGFEQARGSIVAWLNADDVYLPGAVTAGVEALMGQPEAVLVYGQGERIDQHGVLLGPFDGWEPFRLWRLVHMLDFVLQPATFFSKRPVLDLGGLDETLHWSMDWDLWIRLAGIGEVIELDRVLAQAREHGDAKTATGGWQRIRELRRLTRRHAGRGWTPGVRLYALDTVHRQLAARLPAPLRGPWSRIISSAMAWVSQRVPVFADGWLGPGGVIMLPRRWGRARLAFQAVAAPPGGFAVELWAEGSLLGRLRFAAAGGEAIEVELPAGDTPFVTLEARSTYAFRPPPPNPDRRLLTVRSTAVERVSKGA